MTGPVVLAIESATSCVGCAVGTADGVIASTYSARGRRHAESLAPQVRFVMAQAGVEFVDIDHVAVDIGPGLYTGLRVGITTARAMAHMLDVSMVPVTSLEAIAHANRAGGDMVVAIDARRGEVFHAAFTVGTDGELRQPAEMEEAVDIGRVGAVERQRDRITTRDASVVEQLERAVR